jgi:hypothetical protein
MHVDLGRMVVDGGREVNGFTCAWRCRARKGPMSPLARCREAVCLLLRLGLVNMLD